MFDKPLEKIIYDICVSDFYKDDKTRIEEIINTLNDYCALKQQGKIIRGNLKTQVKTFIKFMDSILRYNNSSISPYLHNYEEVGKAYFGNASTFFIIESSSAFVKALPQEGILKVESESDIEQYNKYMKYVEEYKLMNREFKLSLTLSQILAAKKLAPKSKLGIPYKYTIANVADDKDIIHRWLDLSSLEIIFKVLGVTSLDFYTTDYYKDGIIATGHTDNVGDFTVLKAFFRYEANTIDKYEKEKEERRKRLNLETISSDTEKAENTTVEDVSVKKSARNSGIKKFKFKVRSDKNGLE